MARNEKRGKRPKSSASEALWVQLDKLKPDPSNARKHDAGQIDKLRASVRQFGQVWPILVRRKDHMIVAHHGLVEALKAEGFEEGRVMYADGLSPAQQRAFAIADNRLAEISEWDDEALRLELAALAELGFEMDAVGYEAAELERLLSGETARQAANGSLAEQFGVPPFTVLNAKSGAWQKRKAAWLALGIKSEEGRGENLIGRSPQEIFCFETGMHYDKARKIVNEAMAAEGEGFDLGALIAKHRPKGRRTPRAAPGRPGGVYETGKLSDGSGSFRKSGAVVKTGRGSKSATQQLLDIRAAQKAKRREAAN